MTSPHHSPRLPPPLLYLPHLDAQLDENALLSLQILDMTPEQPESADFDGNGLRHVYPRRNSIGGAHITPGFTFGGISAQNASPKSPERQSSPLSRRNSLASLPILQHLQKQYGSLTPRTPEGSPGSPSGSRRGSFVSTSPLSTPGTPTASSPISPIVSAIRSRRNSLSHRLEKKRNPPIDLFNRDSEGNKKKLREYDENLERMRMASMERSSDEPQFRNLFINTAMVQRDQSSRSFSPRVNPEHGAPIVYSFLRRDDGFKNCIMKRRQYEVVKRRKRKKSSVKSSTKSRHQSPPLHYSPVLSISPHHRPSPLTQILARPQSAPPKVSTSTRSPRIQPPPQTTLLIKNWDRITVDKKNMGSGALSSGRRDCFHRHQYDIDYLGSSSAKGKSPSRSSAGRSFSPQKRGSTALIPTPPPVERKSATSARVHSKSNSLLDVKQSSRKNNAVPQSARPSKKFHTPVAQGARLSLSNRRRYSLSPSYRVSSSQKKVRIVTPNSPSLQLESSPLAAQRNQATASFTSWTPRQKEDHSPLSARISIPSWRQRG